jgi:hypothetical protein
MNLRKLISLATLAGFVSLAGAGFAADQKAPAKDQPPAATTSQVPADKGAPEQPASGKKHKKKKHTENKS